MVTPNMPKSPSVFVGISRVRMCFLSYEERSRIAFSDKRLQPGICRRLAEICRSAYYMLCGIIASEIRLQSTRSRTSHFPKQSLMMLRKGTPLADCTSCEAARMLWQYTFGTTRRHCNAVTPVISKSLLVTLSSAAGCLWETHIVSSNLRSPFHEAEVIQ
jgi:hypothetical protein